MEERAPKLRPEGGLKGRKDEDERREERSVSVKQVTKHPC